MSVVFAHSVVTKLNHLTKDCDYISLTQSWKQDSEVQGNLGLNTLDGKPS